MKNDTFEVGLDTFVRRYIVVLTSPDTQLRTIGGVFDDKKEAFAWVYDNVDDEVDGDKGEVLFLVYKATYCTPLKNYNKEDELNNF